MDVSRDAGPATAAPPFWSDRSTWAPLAALAVLLLALWAPVLDSLSQVWMAREELSHGFLVLPASVFFIWARRASLSTLPVRPEPGLGALVLAAGGLAIIAGHAASIIMLASVGLVVTAAGAVLLLFGRGVLKAVRFPILFLVFMTPLADPDPLRWPFQLLSAKVAGHVLAWVGVPAYVENQYIVLPDMLLEVAQVCSGAGYLISVIAVALSVDHLMFRRRRSGVVLVAVGVVIAILANWARVTVISLSAYYFPELPLKPLHTLQGLIVAGAGYVGVFLCAVLLVRRERRRLGPVPDAASPAEPPPAPRAGRWRAGLWTAGALLLLLNGYAVATAARPVPLKEGLATFPGVIDDWVSEPVSLRLVPFRIQGADAELFRRYRTPDGCVADLYVAYLASQRDKKELVNYASAVLHRNAAPAALALRDGSTLTVDQGTLATDRGPLPIVFWYDLDGRAVAGRYKAKLRTVAGALGGGHTNGALVLVAAPPRPDAPPGACDRGRAFAARVWPALRRHLP